MQHGSESIFITDQRLPRKEARNKLPHLANASHLADTVFGHLAEMVLAYNLVTLLSHVPNLPLARLAASYISSLVKVVPLLLAF